jgi:hypothetical protein
MPQLPAFRSFRDSTRRGVRGPNLVVVLSAPPAFSIKLLQWLVTRAVPTTQWHSPCSPNLHLEPNLESRTEAGSRQCSDEVTD